MHAVEGRTSSSLSAHPPSTMTSSGSGPVPGPWEQLAQRWPHTLPASHSMSSVPENDGTVPPRRLAGPREIPASTSLIDGLQNMRLGPREAQYGGSRYRTVSGSAASTSTDKPLPPLPPARTPSQIHHQKMNHIAGAARHTRGPPSFPSNREHLHLHQQQQHQQQQQQTRLPSAPPNLSAPSAYCRATRPIDSRNGRGVAGPSMMQTQPRPHPMHERSRFPSDCSTRSAATSSTSIRAEPTPRPRPHSASPTKRTQRSIPAQQQLRGERLPAMPMPTAISTSSSSASAGRRSASASVARSALPTPPDLTSTAGPSHSSASSQPPRHLITSVEAFPLSPPPPSYDVLFGPRVTFEEEEAYSSRAETESAVELDSRSRPVNSTTVVLPPLKPGQCWGIKRDGGRCTRTVAETSTKNNRARTSQTPSPTKPRRVGGGGASTADEHRRRRRYVSEPPSNYQHRNGNGIGNVLKPIVISDDSSSGSDGDDSIDSTASDIDTDRRHTQFPIYCHQHAKEINKSPGFHLPDAPHTYIPFESYISPNCSPTTAARLRIAMTESLTHADLETPGYIYIYELLPPSSTGPPSSRGQGLGLRLKIGRSHHPMNRIAQWRSQCVNRKPVLRCLYPQPVVAVASSSPNTTQTPRQGLIVGADAVLTQGVRGSHKWEKLVHIELAERCTRLVERCEDCGKRHREIFETTGGARVDEEFRMVCDVVAKWEKFVRICSEHRGTSR